MHNLNVDTFKIKSYSRLGTLHAKKKKNIAKIFRTPFRPRKISGPPFAMKIIGQPHRKACKLSFHWKIVGIFFSRAPLQGSNILTCPLIASDHLTSVCERSLILHPCLKLVVEFYWKLHVWIVNENETNRQTNKQTNFKYIDVYDPLLDGRTWFLCFKNNLHMLQEHPLQKVISHKLVLKSVSYPKIVKNTPILIEQSISCNVYT